MLAIVFCLPTMCTGEHLTVRGCDRHTGVLRKEGSLPSPASRATSLQNEKMMRGVVPLVMQLQQLEWRGQTPGAELQRRVLRVVCAVLKQDRTNIGAYRVVVILMRASGRFDPAERLTKKCQLLLEHSFRSTHRASGASCVFPRCNCNPFITSHYAELVADTGHVLLHRARRQAESPEEATALLRDARSHFLRALRIDNEAIGAFKGLSFVAGMEGRRAERDAYLAKAAQCKRKRDPIRAGINNQTV